MKSKKITIRRTTNLLSVMELVLLYMMIGIVLVINMPSINIVILLFSTIGASLIFYSVIHTHHQESFIIFLMLISAFQNVFLGRLIRYITSNTMPFLVIINYILACMFLGLVVINFKSKIKDYYIRTNLILFFILVMYTFLLYVLKDSSMSAFFASFRNITCPLIFFIIGIYISDSVDIEKLVSIVLILAIIVFLIGVCELTIYKNMWLDLNIGELWDKKGIFFDKSTGRPYNHYSAEIILGLQRRRMVSTFAEPVNLGTFFVLCFFLSYWKKKRLYMIVSVVGCAMTISKGALLGILLMGVVWSFYNFNKKSFIPIAIAFVILFVVAYFGIGSSGASMSIHINGFFASIKSIFKNPLGLGVGNAGVYGNLLNQYTKNQIQESGLGVIIGQLGIIGLAVYIMLFYYQYKIIHKSRMCLDRRTLIFSYSMIYTYIMLIVFSESALGPNASAGFMMIIGVICQRSRILSK